MAMSRKKKLDNMELIEKIVQENLSQSFTEYSRRQESLFSTKELVIGYDEPLSSPLNIPA